MDRISRYESGDIVRQARHVSKRPVQHHEHDSHTGQNRRDSNDSDTSNGGVTEEDTDAGTYDVQGRVHHADDKSDPLPPAHINFRV